MRKTAAQPCVPCAAGGGNLVYFLLAEAHALISAMAKSSDVKKSGGNLSGLLAA
jgi:hypothetical protein